MTSALLWFRRDLRLRDHPALAAASSGNEEVLACFVLDPRLEASSGPRRLQFLGDSLRQLRDDLDGRLLVTRGQPERQISRIAKEIGASAVHISQDFAPFGQRRDEKVRAALESVPLVKTGSPYLVSPGRVTKKDGSPYKVFTPFLSAWREVGWRKPARSGGDSARWLDPVQLRIDQCEIPDHGLVLDLAAGEAAASQRWKSFVDNGLQRYHEDRNRPDLEGTSRMSAHLKFGTIHPRTMVADLNIRGKGAQAYLRELAFRDFYADVLHHWPASAWRNWNGDFDAIKTDTGAAAKRRFESWKAGETGFPIVDAGMRQLRATGFMHNRVRMVVASFLVRTCTCRGSGAPNGSWINSPTATWPTTSMAGSGARDAAPTRRPTSGCSTPARRARSSIPPAITSGAGSPSYGGPTTPTCVNASGRPDTRNRSSSTAPSVPRRCAGTTASEQVLRKAHIRSSLACNHQPIHSCRQAREAIWLARSFGRCWLRVLLPG